ncbi:MAG: hypothetical protein Q7S53_02355 [bacterium]|nr:hypothetical protein [bacterium]
MRSVMIGIIAALLVFSASSGVAVASEVPECYITYSGYPGVLHGSAGETVYMGVSTACPATATIYWGGTNTQVIDIDQAAGGVYLDIPMSVKNNSTRIVELDGTNGTASYHTEARLVIGNPPELHLQLDFYHQMAYWRSYADYCARTLSADYVLYNPGDNDAYAIMVGERASCSNGVEPIGHSLSLVSDKIPAGGMINITRQYRVSQGVTYFRTYLGIRAEDVNGYVHDFGVLPEE